MNTSPPLENVTVCHITIGREREIERLGRLMEQLQAGQGTTVLITGEAGIGKSRLVGEALDVAERLADTLDPGKVAPRLWIARAAALTALRSFESAESLLGDAIQASEAAGLRRLFGSTRFGCHATMRRVIAPSPHAQQTAGSQEGSVRWLNALLKHM